MKITSPTEITDVAWEGTLEPLGQVFGATDVLPRVTLGKPIYWTADQAIEGQTGKKWTPPAAGRVYTLVELTCTLHPLTARGARYTGATLRTYLRPRQGTGRVSAYNLYPMRLTEESKTTFSVGLGPDLSFGETIKLGVLDLGAEIEYRKVFPVIQGYGQGQSDPYWTFAHHAAQPLQGCQSVYLVTATPPDAGGVRLSMELIAEVQTKFGPLRVGLPEEARANASATIGA
jgi:hypothetical protein